jgi:membrane-bound ClpP family serine protease
MPNAQVTLNAEQIDELNQKLSQMRHEINNQLSLVVAAMELIRLKPELRERMIETVTQQPPKITAEVAKFSSEFERALGITR